MNKPSVRFFIKSHSVPSHGLTDSIRMEEAGSLPHGQEPPSLLEVLPCLKRRYLPGADQGYCELAELTQQHLGWARLSAVLCARHMRSGREPPPHPAVCVQSRLLAEGHGAPTGGGGGCSRPLSPFPRLPFTLQQRSKISKVPMSIAKELAHQPGEGKRFSGTRAKPWLV